MGTWRNSPHPPLLGGLFPEGEAGTGNQAGDFPRTVTCIFKKVDDGSYEYFDPAEPCG